MNRASRPTLPPRAKKSLGQNFCVDPALPTAMLRHLALTDQTVLWEIGPGPGALTRELIGHAGELHLFEVDRRCAPILEALGRDHPRIRLHWQDIMTADIPALAPPTAPWAVCGNLPYFVGTAIFQRFLEPPLPQRLVFLLQREVVGKIVARSNDSDFGYLSVRSQLFAEVAAGETFSPESFQPSPKVYSTILTATPLILSAEERGRREQALRIAGKLFEQRRKMALPVFKRTFPALAPQAEPAFERLGIGRTARPQEFSLDQFLGLAELFSVSTKENP